MNSNNVNDEMRYVIVAETMLKVLYDPKME